MRQIFHLFILTTLTLRLHAQIVDGGNGHALILDKQGNVWAIERNNFEMQPAYDDIFLIILFKIM